MKNNKSKNPNVSTSAYLIAKENKTGATRKVGAILYDSITKRDFILVDTSIDLKLFHDPMHSGNFVRLSIADTGGSANE